MKFLTFDDLLRFAQAGFIVKVDKGYYGVNSLVSYFKKTDTNFILCSIDSTYISVETSEFNNQLKLELNETSEQQ